MKEKYELKDGEVFDTSGEEPLKVAVIDKNGTLRMSKGMTDHKEAVEAFLDKKDEEEDGEKQPLTETVIYRPPFNPTSGAVLESCPEGEPHLGDKDPAVIAWHFAKDKAVARVKYAKVKHLWPK